MKRKLFILAAALATGLSLNAIKATAHMGQGFWMGSGMMGRGGNGGWGSPEQGYRMGPGMTGGGYSMRSGMMGHGMGHGMWGDGPETGLGYDYDPGYSPQYPPQNRQPQRPMQEKDAMAILENYISSMRNPNLKLGEIKDRGDAFEAEILTKDNSLVGRVLVDKNTGWMRSAY